MDILRNIDSKDLVLILNNVERKVSVVNASQRKKYNNIVELLKKKKFGILNTDKINNIINLSEHILTDKEKTVLNLGLKFCIPNKKLKFEDICSEFEVLAGQLNHHKPLNDLTKKTLNAKLVAIALNYKDKNKTSTQLDNFYNEFSKTAKQLVNNPNLFISKPDKGSGVVLLQKDKYLAKMNDILLDTNKFEKLGPANNFDNTQKIESATQRRLLSLKNNNKITASVYDAIRPSGSCRPRLYGLPKTHKAKVPLRPVLSMINSPQHKIAKWCVEILKPLESVYSIYCIKDSFSFANDIRQLKISQENISMCSFDIKSLFTSLPIKECINLVVNELFNYRLAPKYLKPEVFKELLILACCGVEFSFNNHMYKQIDGISMGSPLGPILSNIFVGFHEQQLIKDNSLIYYKRYVDDTFAILQTTKIEIHFY